MFDPANIFMLYAPLKGRREAIVTDQRTTIDYAHTIRYLVDLMFPDAEMILLGGSEKTPFLDRNIMP